MLGEGQMHKYTDLIRLDAPKLRAIVEEIELTSRRSVVVEDQRSSARHVCFDYPLSPAQLQHPGGSITLCRVRPRNLSQGGLSLLHGAYVHPGTHVAALVRVNAAAQILIRGKSVYCRHISAHLHEFGVSFDKVVDLAKFGIEEEVFAEGESEEEHEQRVPVPVPGADDPINADHPALGEMMHAITNLTRLLKTEGAVGEVEIEVGRILENARVYGLKVNNKRQEDAA